MATKKTTPTTKKAATPKAAAPAATSPKTGAAAPKTTTPSPKKAAPAPKAAAPASREKAPAPRPAATSPEKKTAPAKKAKPAAAEAVHSVTPEERWQMISEAAYFMAEKRGFTGGNPCDDWAQAESKVVARIPRPAPRVHFLYRSQRES